MSDSENRKRNAHVQQKHHNSRKEVYEEFDNIGLTKRNADYMVRFKEALAQTKVVAEKQTDIIQEMIEEIKTAQKKGTTAKNLYGSVDHAVAMVVNPPKKPMGPMTPERYAIDAGYNVLWFLVLFNFLYGAMFFLSPAAANQGGSAGITCIFISSIVAGIGMPAVTQLFAPGVKHKHNGVVRAGMMALMFVIWMLIFYGSNMLPRVINPVVSPIVNIVIGIIGVGLILLMRSKFTITSGLFAGRK
ncbi:hypothetical protein BGL34_05530 [Fructilactobacillus lindneri]|uniref:Integral membrane protein n=2 Tax=Fructilactobacillus lindneri TaxID=53444 RepID=A0A0R2JSA8_9LACO|nr:DUF1129 family protein [Fructilactobacillus lindneri]ANZ57378.1 hypothetical protein AYR60_00555 [Fructilactobacillus lindneri]ANZ58643.1 hypothetical protein AYR59_00555 [Fructilactobacillus lindneri]KRN79985.1 hypothetical protein IV52_GL000102 [Fructilactobacillus lindneri DSM 20690 = JCM 11027]POG97863.1 hypothetical protein BGL31_04995 [Fructilactobacillus lindneri]POG99195.1 hypothetical protein BGL32_05020 [Fructilactobacillus lindneri]